MFKVKDIVVYPAHGIAIIDEIVEKRVLGNPVTFFKLRLLYKDTKILVPTKNIEKTSLRYLTSEKELNKAWNELYAEPNRLSSIDITPSGWNRRNKEYQMKIQEGKLIEMIRIYRDLMVAAQEKDLSFGERNILHLTEELIVEEIQIGKAERKTPKSI